MSGIFGPVGNTIPVSGAPAFLAPILALFPDADSVVAFLAGRPINVALDFQGAGVAPGFDWLAVEVRSPVPTVEVATDYP